MRKLFAFSLALACFYGVHAQEPLVYQLQHAPTGFDTYKDATYYYGGGKTYNLRNFVLSKADSITDFKVSPDGKTMAAITVNKKGGNPAVVSYNLWETDKKIAKTKKLGFAPTSICYDPNSQRLFVGGNDQAIHVFNVNTMKEVDKTQVNFTPTSLASSPGNLLASINGNTVDVRRISGMSPITTLSYNAPVNNVTFSTDGKQMAVTTSDGQLAVYDTFAFNETHNYDALGLASDCSFNPEGKHIGVVTGSNRIAIINLLNTQEREFVDANGTGIKFIKFVVDPSNNVPYLVFNTTDNVSYLNMSHLSPLRSQLIADRLKERMDEWEQMLPGETNEEYQLRVNDETRLMQMQLFEQEIANDLALSELGLAQMELGSYNTEMQLMALQLNGGLNDIFLEVPANEVAAFKDPANLEFRNVKYGLNDQDEYTLLYADIYNKATGKTYTYDNLQGQFIDYIADESTFAPLDIVEQTVLEENMLLDLTETIINEAKANEILSDHTHIDVSTSLVASKNANGENIRNYEVMVSYTVDQEYSVTEDYAGGKYELNQSPAGTAMMEVVQKALDSEFNKYLTPGKEVIITIMGSADASPIKSKIPYNGCYGNFIDQEVTMNGESSKVTVTTESGITTNEQLAFLRAAGVKETLFDKVPGLKEMDSKIDYDITVSEHKGSEYRKVGVKFVFVDVFEK